jgi:hypothetical protein
MKLPFRTLLAFSLLTSAAGQGTLNFANRIPGGVLDAPVVALDGLGLGVIPGAVAQLFLVNGTRLSPVSPAISFRGTSGALAKYFDGGTITIPGVPVGGSGTFRVRAWVGTSFDTAVGCYLGESANFTVNVLGGDPGNGNPPLLPADMVNLKAFTTVVGCPEPSTMTTLIIALAMFCGVVRIHRAASKSS